MANIFVLGLIFVVLFVAIVFGSGFCVGIYVLTKKFKVLKDHAKINASIRNVESPRYQPRKPTKPQRRSVQKQNDRVYSYINQPYLPPMEVRGALPLQEQPTERNYIDPITFVEQPYYTVNEEQLENEGGENEGEEDVEDIRDDEWDEGQNDVDEQF